MDVWYNSAKAVVGAYVALFIRKIHVEGRENIPSGAKIVVANHALASDGFILPFIIPEKVHYLVQADLFTLPVLGKLLALAGQIPVAPGRGPETIKLAKEKIDQGKTIVLFPEGKLNDGKQLLKAYTGAARLFLETGAPVLPIGFYTPPEFARPLRSRLLNRPTYGSWQFGGPSFISIGRSWKPETESSIVESANQYTKVVREMTDEIMIKISTVVEQARQFATGLMQSTQHS